MALQVLALTQLWLSGWTFQVSTLAAWTALLAGFGFWDSGRLKGELGFRVQGLGSLKRGNWGYG